MKIWVMTNEYNEHFIGGLGVVATQLAASLAERDQNEVHVICIGTNPVVEITRSNSLTPGVIRFPKNTTYFSKAAKKFSEIPISQWLMSNGYHPPDLIHVHSLECSKLAEWYHQRYKVPIVYTCHSLALHKSKFSAKRAIDLRQLRLFRIAKFITVPSLWQKQQICRYKPALKSKITVIPNGVHIRSTTAPSGVAHSERLLFVGRLQRIKGIEELIRAISLVQRHKPNVQLDIVGMGSLYFMNKLERLASRLNVSHRIRWLGKLSHDQVQRIYRSYGCVVVPSRIESFCLVALEAMAHNIPLVATRKGGLSSFVNPQTASIIPVVTPRAIANALNRMWNNPSLTLAKVNKARIAAGKYSWNRILSQYERLFSKIRMANTRK